jgi:NADH-quinone oxidoreductase E subunit
MTTETKPIDIKDILKSCSAGRDSLIPILQDVQERYGYLPPEAIQAVADYVQLSNSTVYGVATFYSHFKLNPGGEHTIRICRGTACHVRGAARILQDMEKRLDIKAGETTPDGKYTLETVACIGACALAPTMTVDKETYGNLTTRKTAEVFDDNRGK